MDNWLQSCEMYFSLGTDKKFHGTSPLEAIIFGYVAMRRKDVVKQVGSCQKEEC